MDKKWKGLLAYLLGWVGGLIVLFAFKDNDRKTAFHACQAITLSVAQTVLSIALSLINTTLALTVGFSLGLISTIVSILFLILMIMGIVKAMNDEPDPKLPVIGDLTEKIFSKKISEFPEAVTAAPKFDPNTGQPVNSAPQANFDPNTGQPINKEPETTPVQEAAPVEEKPEENPVEENKE